MGFGMYTEACAARLENATVWLLQPGAAWPGRADGTCRNKLLAVPNQPMRSLLQIVCAAGTGGAAGACCTLCELDRCIVFATLSVQAL